MNLEQQDVPPLENVLVAALYLATHFARSGCPRLSHMLLHQLEFVAQRTWDGASPMVQQTCQKLFDTWSDIHRERVSALATEAEAASAVVRRVH